MCPVLTVRHGSPTTTVANAALVTISIRRNASGKPTAIVPPADATLYWTRTGKTPTPHRAREVLWVALGLHAGEELRMEAKEDQGRVFDWDTFVLDPENPTVGTGPVATNSKLGRRQTWAYSILLDSPKLAKTLTLDPVIIIQEDP